MVKLVTSSVVRGAQQGESHGGVYLVDLEAQSVEQTIDWNTAGIDWQGRGWDRGLRSIAFDGDRIYIAASDELFAYTPDFELIDSWRNPYLKHCDDHQLSQPRRAIEDYDEVIRLDPGLAGVYVNRGLANTNLGNEDLAERDFDRAVELGFDRGMLDRAKEAQKQD